MSRPNFVEMAREWLVRATGHARKNEEESLARELERVWELGIANSIEALDGIQPDGAHITQAEAIYELRELAAKDRTGAHTCLKAKDGICVICQGRS